MERNLSESKQRAFDAICSLSEKECSALLRLWNNGIDCVNEFIKRGEGGYDSAIRFAEEWEAQHDRV